jgi:hypothetical protein
MTVHLLHFQIDGPRVEWAAPAVPGLIGQGRHHTWFGDDLHPRFQVAVADHGIFGAAVINSTRKRAHFAVTADKAQRIVYFIRGDSRFYLHSFRPSVSDGVRSVLSVPARKTAMLESFWFQRACRAAR